MARDLYVYDVFDIETETYILVDESLSNVIKTLNIDKPRVFNAVKYGQKICKRYIITRTYLDGTINPNDAVEEFELPDDFHPKWDRVCLMINPKARVAK